MTRSLKTAMGEERAGGSENASGAGKDGGTAKPFFLYDPLCVCGC